MSLHLLPSRQGWPQQLGGLLCQRKTARLLPLIWTETESLDDDHSSHYLHRHQNQKILFNIDRHLFIRALTWTGGTWRRVWNESPPRHTSSPSKKTWTRSKKKHQQTGNKYPHQLPILDDLPHHLAALLLLHLQRTSLRQVGHRYLTATCHLKHNLSQQYGEVKEYTETTIGRRIWWFSPLDYDGSVSLCPEGERSRRSHCELPPREVESWIRGNQTKAWFHSLKDLVVCYWWFACFGW